MNTAIFETWINHLFLQILIFFFSFLSTSTTPLITLFYLFSLSLSRWLLYPSFSLLLISFLLMFKVSVCVGLCVRTSLGVIWISWMILGVLIGVFVWYVWRLINFWVESPCLAKLSFIFLAWLVYLKFSFFLSLLKDTKNFLALCFGVIKALWLGEIRVIYFLLHMLLPRSSPIFLILVCCLDVGVLDKARGKGWMGL